MERSNPLAWLASRPQRAQPPQRARGVGAVAIAAVACGLICGTTSPVAIASTPSAATAATATAATASTAAPASSRGWSGAWGSPPSTALQDDAALPDRSVRNLVHLSIGGDTLRVRLTNLYGTAPLRITHAAVALAATPTSAASKPSTTRVLSFAGRADVTIPQGREALSDPVRLPVTAGDTLQVTTYAPDPGGPATLHSYSLQTSYVAAGEHVEEASGQSYATMLSGWHFLAEVAVHASRNRGTVVALGDSITDGADSTANTDRRWPDVLAERLRPRHIGVIDAGLNGNRVLSDSPPGTNGAYGESALKRYDRDVLSRTNVRSVIVLEGVNDIQIDPGETDPARITDGLHQLVVRGHEHGVRVLCSTIMPFRGWSGWSESKEAVRQAVNARIRSGKVCDAVVDFDRVVRDPSDPERMRPDYNFDDGLHPNDLGHRAMADAVPLQLL